MTSYATPIQNGTQRINTQTIVRNRSKAINDCEELAITKLKLQAALKTLQSVETFFEDYFNESGVVQTVVLSSFNTNGSVLPQACNIQPVGLNNTINNASALNQIDNQRMVDLIKERDSLKEELKDLENSYSDLFKRYEKMRENGVLLKNGVESLTQTLEEERAKYDRMVLIYTELRESAAKQLESANCELQQITKEHEENTLNLRFRVKRYESEVNSLNGTIKAKDSQIEELNKLYEELMQKLQLDEIESVDEEY